MATLELTYTFTYPAAMVYGSLKEYDSYPCYMKNIDSVKVLAREECQMQTQWEATLDGKKIMWIEEDVFDDENRTIAYRLLEGDISEMAGRWSVRDIEDGSQVTLNVSFSFANPMLAMFVEPILKRKLEENSQMLLEGINTKLSAQ